MKQITTGLRPFHKVKPPRWEYLVLGLIVLILLVLTLSGILVDKQIEEPRAVSDRFVHSVLGKDVSAAYELTSEPYQQATSPIEFRKIVDEFNNSIKSQPKLKEHKIERATTDILLASVEYDIPGTDDNRLLVKLIKENDNWRVLTINILR